MSRYDTAGLFWEDQPPVRQSAKRAVAEERPRYMPPIPNTGWTTPTEFPRLDAAKVIALDTETKDPHLLDKGPGVRTGGHIVGLSVGTDDGQRWYFPVRHSLGGNMDPGMVFRWAKEELGRETQIKVGANLLYDLDYLAHEGVVVRGPLFDVQVAEPLLDENAVSYSLDSLSRKYLGETKVDELLYDWCYEAYGGRPGRPQAANIWRAPVQLVGPYAEGDVDLPLRIFEKQRVELEKQGLWELFQLESAIIPMLLAMRRRGVAVDTVAAQNAYDALTMEIEELYHSIGGINIHAAAEIAQMCDRAGIVYPYTKTGKPSFTKTWLERHADPRIQAIQNIRTLTKARDTFVKGYILEDHVNGRIHAQFHQLRGDENGTVSGRFSSSNPNLQNIPSRHPRLGPLIRGMFIPEPGEKWLKIDWSQIEYRLLCHYGIGESAEKARKMYREDPSTDFHVFTSELTGVERKSAKGINFGLVYGMGEPSLAGHLGKQLNEVKPIFDAYHENMPFVKETYNVVQSAAQRRGWIRTIGKRLRRFDRWEPSDWNAKSDDFEALPLEEARAKWGARIRRAFCHKALNSLLQGSAADIMKEAMRQIWEAGVCDVLGAPLLTVHDELDWSVPQTKEGMDAAKEVHHIMETCVPLQVPLRAESELGANWGQLDKLSFE